MSFPQTTPLRPVPGAFVNTPAASRAGTEHEPVSRNLFHKAAMESAAKKAAEAAEAAAKAKAAASNSDSQAVVRSGKPGEVANSTTEAGKKDSEAKEDPAKVQQRLEDMPPLLRAAKAVNNALSTDLNLPGVDNYCRREKTIAAIPAGCQTLLTFHRGRVVRL